MKKNKTKSILVTFLILFIQSSSILVAQTNTINTAKQQIIDTCKINLRYRMLVVNNIEQPEKKKENIMLLQIGNRISKFFDVQLFDVESLFEKYSRNEISFSETMSKSMTIGKGSITYNLFKNYPESKITYTDRIPFSGTYKYEEEQEKIKWKLLNGDSVICGYNCRKATAIFRGREYTAWYSEKIPVGTGPWKFGGLPGIILNIYDDKKQYYFECIQVDKPVDISQIYILEKDYINIDRKKYNQLMKEFYNNPGVALQNSGMVKDNTFDKIKSRPYNPIELSE